MNLTNLTHFLEVQAIQLMLNKCINVRRSLISINLQLFPRGTRSTFSSPVPMGSPGQQKNTSVITVILLVEDQQGAKVTALNR